jgi:hypothetical protein
MAKKAPNRDESVFDYDVCLSFAGEDRPYVGRVAAALKSRGVRVFYDEYEKVGLWGKDLYVHLDDVYRNSARYCVLFASSSYAGKLWTNHERESAQARAFEENSEYVLPARFDDTKIPGLRPTVGYIDLRNTDPTELTELIVKKVGIQPLANYLPPVPDRLFERLGVDDDEQMDAVQRDAWDFIGVLKRMSLDERTVVFELFLNGCPTELPENVHINVDLLRRYTGFAPNKLKRLLGGLQSLGFYASLREDDETDGHLGKYEMLVLEWHNMSVEDEADGNATMVACEMVLGAAEEHCETCRKAALERLDFSSLATVTTRAAEH